MGSKLIIFPLFLPNKLEFNSTAMLIKTSMLTVFLFYLNTKIHVHAVHADLEQHGNCWWKNSLTKVNKFEYVM